MLNKGFSIGEVLGFSWNKTKQHWLFLVSYWILTLLISFGGSFLFFQLTAGYDNPVVSVLGQIANSVISMVLTLGWIQSALNVVDGVRPQWSNLVDNWSLVPKYLVALVLYFVIFIVGTLLFVIPGIIWIISSSFFAYYILEKNLGPIKALKASCAMTKGAKWDIAGLGLTGMCAVYFVWFLIVALIAAIYMAFGSSLDNPEVVPVGFYVLFALSSFIILSFVIPMVSIAMAYIYRKLDKATLGVE